MAINTLITLRDALTTFVAEHEQLQRIEFEADDYRATKITEGDEFPVLFVAPIGVDMGNAMNMHRIRIYVYERINDDRSDVWENANDTSLMLRDIRVYWNSYSDSDIQILGEPSGEFKCGDELDNLVGYYADFVFEIPSHGRCDVPINVIPDPSPTCAPASYLVQYVDGTLIESGTIASGGSVTVNVPNAVICQDANYTLTDSDGNVLESGTIPSGGSATIVAPDANISLNGVSFPSILSGGSDNIEVRQSSGSTLIGSQQGAHWRIADSVITLQNSAATTLSTTNVLATDSATIVADDSQINVNGIDVGDVVSVQTIDVNVTDGVDPVTPDTVSLVGNTLTIEVPKDLELFIPYLTSDTTASITILSGSNGTITSADTTGLTSVTFEINAVATTLPLTLAVADLLTINFDAAAADGVIQLSGTYA